MPHESYKENIRIQRWVLLLAILLFSVKVIAWFFTNSLAIFSDALESIVNILAGAVGLYSISLASKPRDSDHPYGHGKAEFISAAFESFFILIAGLYIIYRAIEGFFYPEELGQLSTGIILMVATAVINYIGGYYCEVKGKKNQSLQLIAAGKHLKTDTYSTMAIVIGLVLIKVTGIVHLDGVVAILAALFIIFTGIRMMRISIGGMMDEADKKLLERMVALLNEKRNENWIDLHNMRVIRYGSTLHCDCHLTVPWYLNVREAHEEVTQLRKVIEEEFGTSVEMFVHTDPCMDYSCRICSKVNCHVRKHPMEKKIVWTVDNIVRDRKHRIGTV
ncbi:MAG: cation transporter [Chitinophagaceae bacterium]|nr:cation transporter [Chitinophagaceae bacterium]